MRPGLATTGALARHDYKLEIQCRGCGRTNLVEPHELRRMFPQSVPLLDAGKKLRCRKCGQRKPRMWVWVMGWTRGKGRLAC